jgi:phospholipid-transporting ATPase
MIKLRHPEKTTLSIGDGANDVAMIMKADVGVGISGKEGMQAAQASDFAIGQFRFLKPLLFLHGRECYRRNADLVCYTFYKNMLYIVAQWWFGAFNHFSGQNLYEAMIYQSFNIVFCGIPIMWFALFDWQHQKDDFLKKQNSSWYSIGIRNERFDTKTFIKWVACGITEGLVIIFICFVSVEGIHAVNQSGRMWDFWSGGCNVYWVCIFVANITCLRMLYTWTGWGEAIIALCSFAYFPMIAMENRWSFTPEVYRSLS